VNALRARLAGVPPVVDRSGAASARPPIWLLVLAVIGGCLLLIVAVTRWGVPSDEYAYWLAGERLLAGEPLYDPNAIPGTPYAYFYPPPLAQVLAPFTAFVPDAVYVAAWTALLLVCLWWLAGRQVLVALALVAFIPVAVELWYRNIHLVLAVLIVLGLRRSSAWLAVAAAIKGAPALGLVYFLFARRYRDALVMGAVGSAMLVISVVISPEAWRQFLDVIVADAAGVGASIIPIPFAVRAIVAFGLIVLAGFLSRASDSDAGRGIGRDPRYGEALFVVALVVANPTFWVTSLSMLVAILPLWRSAPRFAAAQRPPG
jgi:alpha-1,2-mannosyltransferase